MIERPAPVGTILLRGLGYGAMWGGISGYLVFPLTQLLSGASLRDVGLGLLLGVLSAPFGMLYGCLAGVVVAGAFAPIRGVRHPGRNARILAAVVAPPVVAAISWLVFRPSLRVGANESRSHVVERVLLFYGVPCACALLIGALFGASLARPFDVDETAPGDRGSAD